MIRFMSKGLSGVVKKGAAEEEPRKTVREKLNKLKIYIWGNRGKGGGKKKKKKPTDKPSWMRFIKCVQMEEN